MQFTQKAFKQLLSFLPGIAKEDRGILAICIGISLIFWLILNLARDYTVNEIVAVSYQLPDDAILLEAPQQVLDVSIRGQGWNLLWKSIKKSDMAIKVDVSSLDEGRLSKGDIAKLIEREFSSSNFEISELNFIATSLKTVQKISKKVPVQLDVQINFAQGYTAYGPLEQSFDSVTISGPAAVLDSIHSWPSQPFVQNELRQDLRAILPLATNNEGVEIISDRELSIHQSVEIVTERSVFVPVEVRNPPKDSFSIFPNQVRLKVAVAQSRYHDIVPDSFQLVVDMQAIGKGGERSNNLALQLTKQAKTALHVSYTPKSVEFYVFSKH